MATAARVSAAPHFPGGLERHWPCLSLEHRQHEASHASRLQHLPALDGLRGVACLAVLAFHLFRPRYWFQGGFLGVDIFFVLSGFLITALLVREWDRTGGVNLKHFYVRRTLRLLPALVTLVAACLIYAWLFAPPGVGRLVRQASVITLCYLSNRPDLTHNLPLGPLAHTWSLAVEEQFYLLWPVLLCLLLRSKARRGCILAIILTGTAASAVARGVLYYQRLSLNTLYFGLETRADALLLGCLVGLLYAWNLLPTAREALALLRLSALAATAGLAYLVAAVSIDDACLYDGVFTLAATAAATVIAALVAAPSRILTAILELPALTWTGRLSYSLYLWHWPVLVWITPDLSAKLSYGNVLGWPRNLAMLAAVGLSFAAAAGSYYGIERPCLRLKSRFSS